MLIDPEQHEVAALVERLPPIPASRVVEIGCGDGRVTRRYSNRVGRVVAIDTDERSISAFREGGMDANVDARALSIDRLDLPDASVDVVLFSWSL
jgi:ubiquinone/menaquinone biosynthesis C-methylase UbiE